MFPILKLLAVLLFKDNRAGFLKPVSQWESVYILHVHKTGDNEYVCLKTHGLTIICRDLYWNERGEGRNGVVLTSCGCSYGRNP